MNNELYHHGVHGQKWGKRNGPPYPLNASSKSASEKKLAREKDKAKKKEMRNAVKNRRSLSDEELKRRTERLKAEREFRNLTDEEINRGRKFAKDFISQNGKKVLSTLAVGGALYATKAIMTKQFDIKELASYMTPKPKNK